MSDSIKKHLDRNVWLEKAVDVLFSHGIGQVKVEILARELGVTKGSFYWHFKNRDELLHGMVDWWRDKQISFLENLDHRRLDNPTGLIKAVIGFTNHTDDSRHDLAMREFARFDEYAATAVAEIDQRRIDHLSALFRAANFDVAEFSLRARALYFCQVGEYTTSLTIDPELGDDHLPVRWRIILRPFLGNRRRFANPGIDHTVAYGL